MSSDDARRLFDGMPSADRISALPDYLLQEILSLLPAQDAVQTCVLARSWRYLWRTTAGLCLEGRDGPVPARDLREFVNNLLIRRDKRTDLHTVKIKFDEFWGNDLPYVTLWIRYAMMCKVRSLILHTHFTEFLYLYRDGIQIASPHLRTIDLVGVGLLETSLDFASCSALENLKLYECHIDLLEISSFSLKHLAFTGCTVRSAVPRLHVSAPGLVSLKLYDFGDLTPIFDNMALLETARVNLGRHCLDSCRNYPDSGILCGADNACRTCGDYRGDPVLLGAISGARHLELISESRNLIFAKDLVHRPIFGNVKTLLLNEYWCEAPGCDRLAYVLKNSPVLKKLTLELFSKGPNHEVEMKGSYRTTEAPSAISEHLKIVQVKCNTVDERILEVLKFLRAFNIHIE